ncbi:unnamed protein product [Brachionus calyciflorus]|uniref:Uncharacterized protein n=1 Tax=Brachionus calyciflorus TaxID=104777 RepID=A0A814DLN2_9BILA|nr:unnamed protein product [Brachionus calyciflorus]
MFESKEEETQTDILDDKSEIRGQMLTRSRRHSQLDHDIFLAMIPDWKYDLNGYYDQLAISLYKWDEFFELCKYKLFNFEDYINNQFFYEIISLHNKLIKEGYKNGILAVLKDLMQRKLHFLIVYVFITNQVPKEFKNVNFLFFGLTDKFPEKINKTKKMIETSSRPILPLEEIFRANDINVDPIYDFN